MSADDILRMRYRERQFLHARDFDDEQGYLIESRRRHEIGEHTWGTVTGLGVEKNGSNIWIVKAGFAVDAYGREIYLFEDEPLDTVKIAGALSGQPAGSLKLWIRYVVEPTSPAISISCGDETLNTRTRESFELIYQDDPPPFNGAPPTAPAAYQDLPDDPAAAPWPVLLGTIQWSAGAITAVDATGRTYAGLRGVEVFSETGQFDIHAPVVRIVPGLATDATLTTEGSTKLHLNTNSGNGGNEVLVDKDDFHALKDVKVDGKITVAETVGDGGGMLQVEADLANDLAVLTRPGDAANGSHNLAIRTNAGAGTHSIVIDLDDLQCAQQLAVDGKFVVKGGIEVRGGQIVLTDAGGGDDTDPMTISRFNRGANHNDFRVQIGDDTSGDDRFVVGPVTSQFLDNFIVDNLGNVLTAGLVNGRNTTGDGTKLDSISPNAREPVVAYGAVLDGVQIPLPAGYAAGQCRAIVSPLGPLGLLSNPILGFDCSVNNATFVVTMKWRVQNGIFSTTFTYVSGLAQYLIIGVR